MIVWKFVTFALLTILCVSCTKYTDLSGEFPQKGFATAPLVQDEIKA
ncbi:MAG: hypothetical protein GWP59_07170 [Chlamydiales bacterium]|nr:hypothetical protein [Chlamydiales bacterium]NCF71465.1 hypothetical protein [Chlamydiales bacterium]